MVSTKATIINPSGLHARPASEFAKAAKKYESAITVCNLAEDPALSVNAKSVIKILSLGIGQGCEVEIRAEGIDEKDAAEGLAALISSGFGE